MNTFSVIGRLVADPDAPKSVGDTTVTKFRIADDGRPVKKQGQIVKDDQGRVVRRVNWWTCEAWGKQGEVIHQYAKKGEKISLSGHLEQEEVEAKDNNPKRTFTTMRVNDFELLGTKSDKAEAPQANNRKPTPGPFPGEDADMNSDDIPF